MLLLDKNKRDSEIAGKCFATSWYVICCTRKPKLKFFYCLEKDWASLHVYLGVNQLGLLVYGQMLSVSESNSMKNKTNSRRPQHMGYELQHIL